MLNNFELFREKNALSVLYFSLHLLDDQAWRQLDFAENFFNYFCKIIPKKAQGQRDVVALMYRKARTKMKLSKKDPLNLQTF